MHIILILVFCALQYGSVENCKVNITLLNDFDFGKFMGLWYETSSYTMETGSGRLQADIEHQCVQTDTGAATVYTQGRTSSSSPCSMTLSNLTTTGESGKLQFETQDGSYHLWIVDTDYIDYALVYGCYIVSTSGSCNGSRAWIWSRSKSLSQSALDRTAVFYTNICLQEQDFETITFNESCSVKIHWRLFDGQDCNVSNIPVQDNFDKTKYFSGTWYEIKWLSSVVYPPELLFQDYLHQYIFTQDGNVSSYVYGRSPSDMQCFYNSAIIEMTDVAGKHFYRPFDFVDSPYWVLSTDYTQYAVVYGCYNVSSDGSCYEARSWIWSRTRTLPDQIMYQANRLLQSACVNPSAYLATEQNNTCSVKTHWRLFDGQDCNVSNIPVQDNFDKTKYFSGSWYEIKWLSSVVYPPELLFQDYLHQYIFTQDGNVSGYAYGRSPSDMQCFYDSSIIEMTDVPGKHIYRPFDFVASPYWVLSTDYTQYAVVYGCYNVSSDGSCYEARSWIWSRTRTLPDQIMYQANSLLQSACVNPSAYLPTEQNNMCAQTASWNIGNRQNCNFTRVATVVQENFSSDKFSRVWYELSSVSTTAPKVTDRRLEVFFNSDGDMTVFSRFREGSSCKYTKKTYTKTNQPGKFREGAFNVWVAGTDYSSYAVLYTCERVGSDGQCETARGSVWSRSPTLPPQHQYTANSLLQDLCLNPAALVTISHSNDCKPQEMIPCTGTSDAAPLCSTRVYLISIISCLLYTM